jgi:hypothetical protein
MRMVLVSEAAADHWVFSTIRAGAPLLEGGAHPVSGNRAFGFWQREDGAFVFYTAAADRPTRGIDAMMQDKVVFPMADRLWRGLQTSIATDINQRGGRAEVASPQILRMEAISPGRSAHEGLPPLAPR